MKNLFLFSLLSIFVLSLNAQKGKDNGAFEGTITYSVTTEGEFDANTKAQLPTEVVWTFKGPKTSMLMKTGFGNITILANAESKEQVVLYDMMGQKMAIKSTKEETEKSLSEIPDAKVTETTETKKILNYNCKKVQISDDKSSMDVYVTDEIQVPNANWNTQYKNVKGLMLEYSQKGSPDSDAKMIFTAKEVKKGKVKDSVFDIPTDYKQMSMSEFKQMFGGGEE
jgi:GLPGLI family protein